MKILDFVQTNCKNCYKCIRNCNVKAIKMLNDQAIIMEEKCIACGECFLVCPQNARNISSDLDKIKAAISQGKKVVISIAPSYLGVFKEPYKVIGALKKSGIFEIEETSVGATVVTSLYKDYIKNSGKKNLLTSCCPSANLMIQTYYPELLEYLMPIDSPMIVHCKLLRKKHGNDAFIAFLGPCIAKKIEAFPYQSSDTIDAVVSFEEIEQFFDELGIKADECEESNPCSTGDLDGQMYPLEKGILKGVMDIAKKENYACLSVMGAKGCKELFEGLKNNLLENIFAEINICYGGCIGGPAVSKDEKNLFVRDISIRKKLEEERFEKPYTYNIDELDYNRNFVNRYCVEELFSEEQIQATLERMGKHLKSDILNCGSCGYDTCKEKAISVLSGFSYPEMCLPYMRSKAERISNISFEYSPNILFIMDENLNILEINPKAEQAFNITSKQINGSHLSTLMPTDDFKNIIQTGISIINKKMFIDKYNLTVYNSTIYLPKLKMLLTIMLDVSHEEEKKDKIMRLKLNTIETADKVIEKQMRVAQEIAGLLGETTAETKVTLLKLKKIFTDEDGDM